MDVLKVEGGALYQWDTGRRVVIKPAEGCTVSEAHFANPDGDEALIVELKTENGRIIAPIPNILLHGSGHIHVFATIVTADGRRTICDKIFNIRPRQKPSDYVYTETEVYSIKTALEKALLEAKESGEFNGPSEWDYVITSLEDFTTEKLATMSGRVLVKGVNIEGYLGVTIPSRISHIGFIDSKFGYVNITAESKNTSISGLVGYEIDTGVELLYPILTNFGTVEHCTGTIALENCENISHCQIRQATNCTNLSDLECGIGGFGHSILVNFNNCILLDNIRIHNPTGHEVVEFDNCKHISNVHIIEGNDDGISYVNCDWVDGDTCDGYYSTEDEGKVQMVNTDGTKSLISVYDKDEIDTKLGDISTILTALHEGGIE